MRFLSICLTMSILLLMTTGSVAKIYKYQKDGTWYFTDSPPDDMPTDRQEIPESSKATTPSDKEKSQILKDYPARNAIERAALSTVAIQTALGYGSGFFVSNAGHIITNKHVIRIPERQSEQIDDYFGRMDHRAKEIQKRFSDEKRRMDDYKRRLDELKKMAENETDSSRKASYAKEYRFREQEYDRWRMDFKKREREFLSQFDQYETNRQDFHYERSVASLSQSFTITLVDDSEHYAYLVAISETHDLALLKIDAPKTPMLYPADLSALAQGDPVYAIGNPAQLRNTVTSGVFSGYEKSYIQTNAQISPGNSGGPLIDSDGRVIGVNTKKKIGGAFEGLGFAIPIETALEEFRSHLP